MMGWLLLIMIDEYQYGWIGELMFWWGWLMGLWMLIGDIFVHFDEDHVYDEKHALDKV